MLVPSESVIHLSPMILHFGKYIFHMKNRSFFVYHGEMLSRWYHRDTYIQIYGIRVDLGGESKRARENQASPSRADSDREREATWASGSMAPQVKSVKS